MTKNPFVVMEIISGIPGAIFTEEDENKAIEVAMSIISDNEPSETNDEVIKSLLLTNRNYQVDSDVCIYIVKPSSFDYIRIVFGGANPKERVFRIPCSDGEGVDINDCKNYLLHNDLIDEYEYANILSMQKITKEEYFKERE